MKLDTQTSHELFAAWLAEVYPEVFNELAKAAGTQNTATTLSGFMDILRSVGSGIVTATRTISSSFGGAVKQVGSFLASDAGKSTIEGIVGLYAAKQGMNANLAAISLQGERASANEAPAPIQTVYDPATGQYIPVLSPTPDQNYALNSSLIQELRPSFLDRYGVWVLGGGLLLVTLIYIHRSNRR